MPTPLIRIVSMKKQALRHSEPDEHLYGRAGYLYTLMYLRRELGQHAVDSQHITDVSESDALSRSFGWCRLDFRSDDQIRRAIRSRHSLTVAVDVQMARFGIHGRCAWCHGNNLYAVTSE